MQKKHTNAHISLHIETQQTTYLLLNLGVKVNPSSIMVEFNKTKQKQIKRWKFILQTDNKIKPASVSKW